MNQTTWNLERARIRAEFQTDEQPHAKVVAEPNVGFWFMLVCVGLIALTVGFKL